MSEISGTEFRGLIAGLKTDGERARTARDIAPSVLDKASASRAVVELIRDDEQRSLALRAINPPHKWVGNVAAATGLLAAGAVLATVLHAPITSLFAGRHAALPQAVPEVVQPRVTVSPPTVIVAPPAVAPTEPTTLAQVNATTRMGSYSWADLAEKSGQKGHYATHLATKEVLTPAEQERGWQGGFTLDEYNTHLERLYAKTSEVDMRGYFDSPAGWNEFKHKLDKKQAASLKAGTMRVVDMMNVRDAGPGYEPLPTTFKPITLPTKPG